MLKKNSLKRILALLCQKLQGNTMSNETDEISNFNFISPHKSTSGRKFQIVDLSLPYQPEEMGEPQYSIIPSIGSDFVEGQNVTHRLYISEQARKQIFRHIGWGKNIADNQVEQGGIMVGHAFVDKEKGLTVGVVRQAFTGQSARGSGAYLELSHQTWKEMVDQVDEFLDANPSEDFQIIGWYHTHPNGLSVFMSGTDRATQSRMFAEIWQFAIVLNPHKQIWRAFYGKDAVECKGFMLAYTGT